MGQHEVSSYLEKVNGHGDVAAFARDKAWLVVIVAAVPSQVSLLL